MCGAVRFELASDPFDCWLVSLPDLPADQRHRRQWSLPAFRSRISVVPQAKARSAA